MRSAGLCAGAQLKSAWERWWIGAQSWWLVALCIHWLKLAVRCHSETKPQLLYVRSMGGEHKLLLLSVTKQKRRENKLKLYLFYPTISVWAWKSSKMWMRNVLLEEIALISLAERRNHQSLLWIVSFPYFVYFCLGPSCYLWCLASSFLCCTAEARRNECWTYGIECNLMLVHASHRNWHLHRQRDFSRSGCNQWFG